MRQNRKAMLESTLGKVVFGVVVILVLLAIVLLFKGTLGQVWDSFVSAFRFGG